MKNFRDYLTESERSYNYRIKLVGDLPDGFLAGLKGRFDQFDPVKIGDQKSTPIQAKPADFPTAENQKVTHFDVELRYPAIEPQIKQIAQLMGFDPNNIIMQTSVYDDSVAEEQAQRDSQPDCLLADTDYPAPTAEQKLLSKDYAADPYEHGVLKNAYRSNFTIAGGKTRPAETTNSLKQGNTSPMTHAEKRPPKPATGAQPKG